MSDNTLTHRYMIGGAMHWYVVNLLRAVEKHLSKTAPWESAGSAKWLAHHLNQGFNTSDMLAAGFCQRDAICVRKMKISGGPIEKALNEVIREQMSKLKVLFKMNAPVATIALLTHIQGIASSEVFNHPVKTCSWLRDCVLATLEGAQLGANPKGGK